MRFVLAALAFIICAPAQAVTVISGTAANGILDYQDDGSLFGEGLTRVVFRTDGSLIFRAFTGLTTQLAGNTTVDTCDFAGYCESNGVEAIGFISDYWSDNDATPEVAYTVSKPAGATMSNHYLQVKSAITGRPFSYTLSFYGNAVPEPASWAMMIAGFGMAGSALRRRKQFAPAL